MAKRTELSILQDLRNVENALSPENLNCDGEISASEAQMKYIELMKKRKALIAELGREPTDREMYPL